MRISRTPGAAVATNSKARASGPMRPTTGTRRLSRRYSRSDASVSIDIVDSLGSTSAGWKPVWPVSRASASAPLASISQRRVRLPRLAARRASDEATVVLPTPPLPVTKRSLRSRMSAGTRRPAPAGASSGGTEADPAVLAGHAHLDVGHPGHRHADPPASAVGQPQDGVGAAEGRVDVVHQLVAVGVVGDLDLDLLGRVDDADTDVHQRAPLVGGARRWTGPAMVCRSGTDAGRRDGSGGVGVLARGGGAAGDIVTPGGQTGPHGLERADATDPLRGERAGPALGGDDGRLFRRSV